MKNKPKFEVFKGLNDLYYFRFVAGNGEIMAHSEGYDSKSNVKRAIVQLKELLKDPDLLFKNIK